MLSPWNDVVLTEAETAAALDEARRVKYEAQREEYKREQIRLIIKAANTAWTPEELSDFVLNTTALKLNLSYVHEGTRYPGFEFTDDNRYVFEALCFYFTKDTRFEQIGRERFGEFGELWDLNKGIYLFGGIGVGKTTLMNLFAVNKRQCYRQIQSRLIANGYSATKGGQEFLQQFMYLENNTTNDISTFFQRKMGHCYDDLGAETTAAHSFGNKKNVMSEVLLSRYDQVEFRRMEGHHTHVTSNLSGQQVEDLYGPRVRSRMRQLFNIIQVPGTDRRA